MKLTPGLSIPTGPNLKSMFLCGPHFFLLLFLKRLKHKTKLPLANLTKLSLSKSVKGYIQIRTYTFLCRCSTVDSAVKWFKKQVVAAKIHTKEELKYLVRGSP